MVNADAIISIGAVFGNVSVKSSAFAQIFRFILHRNNLRNETSLCGSP